MKKMNQDRITHGHSLNGKISKTYSTWMNMKRRCLDKTNKKFEYYGGRGVSLCNEWLDFNNFLRDMGERPDGLTLDRIDNNQGYFKENCRWASNAEQAHKKRKMGGCTSKYFGVSFKKELNKWQANVSKDFKQNYLGVFETEEQAAMAYNIKAKELYGETARLNDVPTASTHPENVSKN